MADEYTALVLAAQGDGDLVRRHAAMGAIGVVAPMVNGDAMTAADQAAAPILALLYPPPPAPAGTRTARVPADPVLAPAEREALAAFAQIAAAAVSAARSGARQEGNHDGVHGP